MVIEGNYVITHKESAQLFIENAENFAVDSTQKNPKLFGKKFVAPFNKGAFTVSHSFNADGKSLQWEVLSGENKGKNGSSDYQAFEIRPNLTIVTFKPRDNESTIIAIDENNNVIHGFMGRYEKGSSETGIQLISLACSLIENDNFEIKSADMTDTSFRVKYANGAAMYRHMYINPYYISWHCYKGTSQGVVNTERYYAFEIAPKIYLLAWNEDVAPLQLSMIFDLEEKKEYATFFCYNKTKDKTIQQFTTADIEDITLNGLKL